jgi:hypothetical protein
MCAEIKTRKCFLQLADAANAERRPAAAFARRLGTGVPAGRMELHAASRRGRSLVTNHSRARQPKGGPLASVFLIGTPRLEFRACARKQRPDAISDRDTLALFHAENPAWFTRDGGRIATFPRLPRHARHLEPVRRGVRLIYGSAIRIPCKVLKP